MYNSNQVFYQPEFVKSCTDAVWNTPFWGEGPDGDVLPFTKDTINTCVSIYYANALPNMGFYNLPVGNDLIPVQVKGNVIREIDDHQLKKFVLNVMGRVPGGDMIIDQMVYNFNRFFGSHNLSSLRVLHGWKEMKDSRSRAYRFYRNGVVEINSKDEAINLIAYEDLPEDTFVWVGKIIDRSFDPSLIGPFNQDEFLTDITDKPGNHFAKWCQNLCKSRQDSSWVYSPERFKSLASSFGYLLHQHWNDYKCVIFSDEDMVDGQANGRTGKSVVLHDALSHALDTAVIDAREMNSKRESNFTFNFVTPSTQYICLDDASEDFAFKSLFSKITGPITINRKYGTMFQFGKNEKPKISISTNHPILGDGPSYQDRQHIVEIGGFYRFHKMEMNKTPDQFHGGWLFDEEWGDVNWQEFDAFCVNSLYYYLKNGLRGGGSGEKYRMNKLIASVGSAELVSTLHRFLEEFDNETAYQKSVDEMDELDKERCLDTFVSQYCGDEYPINVLSDGLNQVARHYHYDINEGGKKRPQKRFGPNKKGVNLYRIRSTFKSPKAVFSASHAEETAEV